MELHLIFMGRMRSGLAALLWLALCAGATAQTGLKIEYLTPEDGLSFRWVQDIAQDREGYLWFATTDGLNRYDGNEIRIFRNVAGDSNSIAFNQHFSVDESADGLLWLSSGVGRDIFDPTSMRFRRHRPGVDVFQVNGKGPWRIKNGITIGLPEIDRWLEEGDPGLDPQTWRFVVDRLRKAHHSGMINAAPRDVMGNLWVLPHLDQIYLRFASKHQRWQVIELIEAIKAQPGGQDGMPIDTRGRFWFPDLQTVDQPSFKSFQLPMDIPPKSWLGYAIDNHLNIWLSTDDKRLYRYHRGEGRLEFFGAGIEKVLSVLEDAEGVIWVGGESGIVKIRKSGAHFENYGNLPFRLDANPPIGLSARHIAEAPNGDIYTHAGYGALYRIPKGKNQPEEVKIAATGRTEVTKVSLASDGRLWVSTIFQGLIAIDPYSGVQQVFPAPADAQLTGFFENRKEGKILCASRGDGLFIFDMASKSFLPERRFPKFDFEMAFFLEEEQIFFTNYNNGLARLNWRSGEERHVALFPEGEQKKIRAFLLQGDRLWVGSLLGLVECDARGGEPIRYYNEEDGLPHPIVYSILPDEAGRLWLGTHFGLCRFDPRTLEVKNFFVEDGLSHHEFNTFAAMIGRDGKFWMGGLNGLNAFHPGELDKVAAYAPRLYWTSFSKYNQANNNLIRFFAGRGDSLPYFDLSPHERYFTLRFALLRLANPAKNSYAYYLEGYEPPWRHTSATPLATYQNIPPGRYTLRVRAADYRGDPALNELAIGIRVRQIWYKRWWAIALFALALGVAVVLLYRFQLYRKLDQEEARRLKELDNLRNRLYANITHEFRTPLTVILGMGEAVERYHNAGAGERLREAAGLIQRNGRQLLLLVNQLLDLAKLESGAMPRRLSAGDIVGFIAYVVESFHSLAEMKGIRLHLLSEIDARHAAYDRDKLEKILSNLLSNAIKFTPEGGDVYLQVNETRVGDNALLRIQVRDSGIGIAEEDLPRIFDRFYQVDGSHTRQGEGTGIGLALTQELVKHLGGTIAVRSAPGQGATFTVEIPLMEKADSVSADEAPGASTELASEWYEQAAPSVAPLAFSLTTEKSHQPLLLIIEDNKDLVRYLQSCLENEYQLLHARNGKEGIDLALENVPDVIVSDVMMPEKDGYEVCAILKNDLRTSHIPIVLLTAKTDLSSKIYGLESGADDYLAKPFHREELLARVNNLIDLRRKLQARYADLLNDGPNDTAPVSLEDQFLRQVQDLVNQRLQDPHFGIPQLCRELGLSQSQLYRKLKALTGKSTAIYIRGLRLRRGLELLRQTDLSVSEIAYEVGFNDPAYFSRTFSEEFGGPPNAMRE